MVRSELLTSPDNDVYGYHCRFSGRWRYTLTLPTQARTVRKILTYVVA